MTIVYTISAIIAAIALIALLLPRKVVVTRQADVTMHPEDVIARVASTAGFQTFNPYCTTDPALKIEAFGPETGVGSGFRFEGKEGKGTQTVTVVSASKVTHLIDLGAMGKPVQTIEATPNGEGADVVWTVTSDMGYNPVFRIFGLFMDRMLGKTYELGGPRTYTFKELYTYIGETIDRKRYALPLPFFVAKPMGLTFGALFRYVWPLSTGILGAPPLTGDQVTMLKTDNTVSEDALTLEDLGVEQLETVEAIVPSYLYRFRPYGQYHQKTETV